MKMNHSGMSRFTAKMLVKRQNDRLFGTFKFPAEHALRAYLDTLTDDNLLDLALLYYMAETNDVTLSVEPGEPRLTGSLTLAFGLYGFCSSGQSFASVFLQIPSRGGHP